MGTPAPTAPTQLSMGGTLPSPPQANHSGGEGFPIPGKPRLLSIQPQNNPRAGCQLPASTLLPKPGRRQAAPEGLRVLWTPPPRAGQAHRGEMERSSPPWADPTAGLPPALPALPTLPACPDWAVLIPRAAPVKNRRRALSRADFPLFLLKIIFKNLK